MGHLWQHLGNRKDQPMWLRAHALIHTRACYFTQGSNPDPVRYWHWDLSKSLYFSERISLTIKGAKSSFLMSCCKGSVIHEFLAQVSA